MNTQSEMASKILPDLMFNLNFFPVQPEEVELELTGTHDFYRFAALAQLDQVQPLDLTVDRVLILIGEFVEAYMRGGGCSEMTELARRVPVTRFASVYFGQASEMERREFCESLMQGVTHKTKLMHAHRQLFGKN